MIKGGTVVVQKCVGTESSTVKFALFTFKKQKPLKAVHVHINNTTPLVYLVKNGGWRDRGLSVIEIWKYLLKHQITTAAEYLLESFWKLCPKLFQQVCQRRKMPKVDLFASRLFDQLA